MKRILLPTPAISLRRLFVCLITIGVAGTIPAFASISVGDYNGGGPSTVSSFGDDTLGGASTVNSGHHTFNGSATNLAGATLTLSHGSSLQQWDGTGGGGVFYNKGTWNYSGTARGGFSIRGGTMTVRNQGTFDSTAPTASGGNFYFSHSSGPGTKRWINEAGSIFRHSAATTFDTEVAGTTYFIHDGTTIATNGGTINFAGGVHSGTGTFNTQDGSIGLSGAISNLQGTVVGDDPVESVGTLSVDSDTEVAHLEFSGAGFKWNNSVINHGTKILTFGGAVESSKTSGTQIIGNSGGHFRNIGTLTWNSTADLSWDMQTWSRFRNAGIFSIESASGNREIYGRGALCEFYNEATGVITQNMTSGEFDLSGGAGNFRNAGTIVVNGQNFDVDFWTFDTNTVSAGNDLLEGTWIADGGDIQLPGNLWDTIGANARVVLGAVGNVNRISAGTFATLNGTFGLHNGRTYTASTAFTGGSSANFEFGLNNSGTDASLEISANSALDGVVDVIDLDGDVSQGSYVVITNSGGTTLTDNGIAAGTLTTSQNLSFSITVYAGANGYVEVSLTPPPTGAVLYVE
jgi:hypothetical protein